jgi:hypothetical protein
MKDFDDPQSAVNSLVGKGFVAAAMTRWVSGGRVYGDHRRGRFLDRLAAPPPEVWEIRVTEPTVQARLFGRFAEPDTLILTKFHTRSYLGKRGSAAWNAAMTTCVQTWDATFLGIPAHSGSTIGDFVTENCDDFPLAQ